MSLQKLNERAEEYTLEEDYIHKGEEGRLAFVEKFPLDQLANMHIDEYVIGSDQNSFCYWLEFKKIGFGVGGGNASKYGIYKKSKSLDDAYVIGKGKDKKIITLAEAEVYFKSLSKGIVQALAYAEQDEIEKLKELQLPIWNIILQKILSMYFPNKFLEIGASDVVLECARDIGVDYIELSTENLIQINYECKKALSKLPEYANWPSNKIGKFVWDSYKDDAKRDYYILGSTNRARKQLDIFPEMFEFSKIAIGYAKELDLTEFYLKSSKEITNYLKEQGEESNSYSALKTFLALKVGDRVAIKGPSSSMGKKGFLSVLGIAEVIEKDGQVYQYDPNGLGHILHVKFLQAPIFEEFEIGGFGGTIRRVTKAEHINQIFKGEFETKALEAMQHNYKQEFIAWLEKKHQDSGTVKSYVKSLEVLSGIIERELFTTTDDAFLEELYKDLIVEQKNEKGKYFYKDSPSLGTHGFYSASVRAFREFLQEKNSALSLFEQTRIKFKREEFNNYLYYLRKLTSDLDIRPHDQRVVFSLRAGRLAFTVGQRYCFSLFQNDPRGRYGVISTTALTENSETYEGKPPQPYFNYSDEFQPKSDEWNSILEAVRNELARTTISGFRKHNDQKFENYVFGLENKKVKNDMSMPLNTILYGPPGTGKTYKLSSEYFDLFTSSEISLSPEQNLANLIADLTWWECLGMTLSDLGESNVTDILNHPYMQAKASMSESKNVRAAIWGNLQTHTIDGCEFVGYDLRRPPQIFEKTEASNWKLADDIEQLYPEANQLHHDIQNYTPTADKQIKRYEFVTFHQSFTYEDFIEGIKPVMGEENDGELKYEIQAGVFKDLAERARREPEQNFALFIDEINRGNVSSIFGELITLIEKDKRTGAANELQVTLPYSKKSFSVPDNLYLIGTMNTADRSVEALDTALRRRFEFVEMPPKYDLEILDYSMAGVHIPTLLKTINQRIEKLLNKDHLIGHSYFIGLESPEDLKACFRNKILPLLQEYFFGDFGKIGLVLGDSFIDSDKNKFIGFGDYNYEDSSLKTDFEERAVIKIAKEKAWDFKAILPPTETS